MKHRIKLSLFATALFAGTILSGCGTNEKTEVDTAKTESEVVIDAEKEKESLKETVAVEESATGIQLDAYMKMMAEAGKAKEGIAVDWELVSSVYTESLQGVVNEIDGTFDQSIEAAIGAAIHNEIEPIIAKQLVDKLLQSYFYQKQKRLHKDVIAALETGDQQKAELAFEELKYLANTLLIPTAVKRDGYYELKNEFSMEQNILTGLASQEVALKDGNANDYSLYTQMTDKSIYRSYYLAANSYAEKIESGAKEGKSTLDLQNMQAEAWGFYQAIKGSLSGGDKVAATRLDEIFSLSTPANTIQSQEVNDLFTSAFVGKITSYHSKVIKALEENNTVEAKIEALEGNMFLKAIEIDLKVKIGEEKTAEVLKQAEEWFSAISTGNDDEVATHSKAVLATLSAF